MTELFVFFLLVTVIIVSNFISEHLFRLFIISLAALALLYLIWRRERRR